MPTSTHVSYVYCTPHPQWRIDDTKKNMNTTTTTTANTTTTNAAANTNNINTTTKANSLPFRDCGNQTSICIWPKVSRHVLRRCWRQLSQVSRNHRLQANAPLPRIFGCVQADVPSGISESEMMTLWLRGCRKRQSRRPSGYPWV